MRLTGAVLLGLALALAALYAAAPQLTRHLATVLAGRLGVTLETLDVGRPGLRGLQIRQLKVSADRAQLALDEATVSYTLRGLLAGQLGTLEIGTAVLTLTEAESGSGLSPASPGDDIDAAALAGWTERIPMAAVTVSALEIQAPRAGFAASGALQYGADGLRLSLSGREPEAASRLELALAVSPEGVVQARLADRAAPDTPFLEVVSSLAADALSVEAELALSGFPLRLVSELAGLPPGDGALRASLSSRLPWPVPDTELWQAVTVSGPAGLDWVSADGSFEARSLAASVQLREGVLELRAEGRLRLQRGSLTATAQLPEGYELRFDGSRLEGGAGLALRVAGDDVVGEAQVAALALAPGARPQLEIAGHVVATVGGAKIDGAVQLDAQRVEEDRYQGNADFAGSVRLDRVEATGTLEADLEASGGALSVSGDAAAEPLGRMTFDGRYRFASAAGQARVEGATQLRGPLLERALRGWREPWDLQGGRLGYALDLSWSETAELGGRARLALVDVSAHYGSVTAKGINGELTLRGAGTAWVFDETPVTVASVDFGVTASEISVFIAWNGAELQVRGASAALLGGGVTAAPFSYYPATGYGAIDLRLVEVSLAEVLALEGDDISGTGRLDGTLPIRLLGNAASVEAGRIRAAGPGGTIRVSEDFRVPSGQPGLDFALRALHNFDYSLLEADVDYAENGDLQLAVRLRGRNPDVEGGRPIHYNLNISENVPLLLKSLRLQDRVTREVERRVRN